MKKNQESVLTVIAAMLLWLAPSAWADAGAKPAAELSLEELLQAEVQTASRKSQRLQDVAAAVFVITRDDIERSGATSLPEVLRLAPGVQVARLANNRWAVSARGFNGRFANKLLVLMDGRSIYSPLFSGVLWEMEDTLLEDIERIEVIRGPGAALWGANAVNGVINIISRHARDTVGSLAVAGAGSEEKAFGALRHGFAAGPGHLRLWAKAFARDRSVDSAGVAANDDWRGLRAGLRGDWTLGAEHRLSLTSALRSGPTGDRWNLASLSSPTGSVPTDMEQSGQGAHLLLKHDWLPADGSANTLQLSIDDSRFDVKGAVGERRRTVDIDFQRRLAGDGAHDVIWGLAHRLSSDQLQSSAVISFLPERREFRHTSVFVHDEITLAPESLRLVLGARLEHNNRTGLEPQPNARLIWTPTPQQAFWGALSRAVRTPSRAEQDGGADVAVLPAGPMSPPVLLRNVAAGERPLLSETVQALEFGYRQRFDAQLALDLTMFRNRYDRLRGVQAGAQRLSFAPQLHVVQEIAPNNDSQGSTTGVEIVVDWQPYRWWRLQGGYSHLRTSIEARSADPIAQAFAGELRTSAPRHQASLRSSLSLERRQQLDFWLRHVGTLASGSAGNAKVPAYTTLDLRYAWRVGSGVEFTLVGQNLLDARHAEFVPELLPSQATQVERGWYAKAKWQF